MDQVKTTFLSLFTDQKINYGAYGGAEPASHEMEQVKTTFLSLFTDQKINYGAYGGAEPTMRWTR